MDPNYEAKFDERLVDKVREHPMIYDSKHEDYKNRKLKDEIWKSIGKDLGYLGDDCQYRWRVIRDRYVKKKKEMIRKPEVTEDKIVSTWKLFYQVDEFLSPYIVHRHRLPQPYYDENNQLIYIKEEDSGSPLQLPMLDDGSTPPYVAFESTLEESVNDVTDGTNDVTSEQKPPKLSHYNSDIHSDITDLSRLQQNGLITLDDPLRQISNSRKRRAIIKEDESRRSTLPIPNERFNSLDEESHFGCIVTSTLRRLSPKQRALGKLKLTELLYKLEFPDESPIEMHVNSSEDVS